MKETHNQLRKVLNNERNAHLIAKVLNNERNAYSIAKDSKQ